MAGTLLGIFLLVAPSLFAAEETPRNVPTGGEMAESVPGMNTSIQNAQQQVQDPFARRFAPAPPKAQEQVRAAEVVAVLQGIGLGAKGAYAVIGDSVYYKGEEKNGIKLLELRRGEVDIFVNGATATLPLFPGEELKKAQARQEKKRG